jgi:phosphopantothenate-cysteine ligase
VCSPLDTFFSESPSFVPRDMDSTVARMDAFVQRHAARRIVLVTSGGTTVRLEKKTVRLLRTANHFSLSSIHSAFLSL